MYSQLEKISFIIIWQFSGRVKGSHGKKGNSVFPLQAHTYVPEECRSVAIAAVGCHVVDEG